MFDVEKSFSSPEMARRSHSDIKFPHLFHIVLYIFFMLRKTDSVHKNPLRSTEASLANRTRIHGTTGTRMHWDASKNRKKTTTTASTTTTNIRRHFPYKLSPGIFCKKKNGTNKIKKQSFSSFRKVFCNPPSQCIYIIYCIFQHAPASKDTPPPDGETAWRDEDNKKNVGGTKSVTTRCRRHSP